MKKWTHSLKLHYIGMAGDDCFQTPNFIRMVIRMKNGLNQKRSDVKIAYIMLLPLLGLLSVFVVYPLFYAAFVSFFQWNFYQDSIFIGLSNYKAVITDSLFYKSLWTGLKFALLVIPAQFVAAFLFANLIRSIGGKLSGFVKTSIYIPHVISGVVASIIFIFIYDYHGGLANYLVEFFWIRASCVARRY